jgi:hypothetical protein
MDQSSHWRRSLLPASSFLGDLSETLVGDNLDACPVFATRPHKQQRTSENHAIGDGGVDKRIRTGRERRSVQGFGGCGGLELVRKPCLFHEPLQAALPNLLHDLKQSTGMSYLLASHDVRLEE